MSSSPSFNHNITKANKLTILAPNRQQQNDLKLDVIILGYSILLCHLTQISRHFSSINALFVHFLFCFSLQHFHFNCVDAVFIFVLFHNTTHERCLPVDCFDGALKLLSSFSNIEQFPPVEKSVFVFFSGIWFLWSWLHNICSHPGA